MKESVREFARWLRRLGNKSQGGASHDRAIMLETFNELRDLSGEP